MEAARAALYRAVHARLTSAGSANWTGVYADMAPAKPAAERPYVLFFLASGGERNTHVEPDAEIVLTVKIVADSQMTAFAALGQLSGLLNDAGAYDRTETPLDGGADWLIRTTTQERDVHQVYLVDGQRVYEEGFQLRVMMSKR
jgi:hypothetical protein